MVSIYVYILIALFKYGESCRMCIKLPFNFFAFTSSTSHCSKSTYQTIPTEDPHLWYQQNVLRCHRIMKRYDVDYLPQRKKKYIFFINSLNSISSISTSEKPLILCLCAQHCEPQKHWLDGSIAGSVASFYA